MKKLAVLLVFTATLAISGLYAQDSIQMLLPDAKCSGIKIVEDPQLFAGDDLFNLINGGAELYHEYGFVAVISSRIKAGKDTVTVEIYDMGSQEGAWGIFSMTVSSKAIPIVLGDTGRKGLGFNQFIKDRYMVYIYYKKVDEKLLKKLSDCILKKIPNTSTPPYPMELLAVVTDKGTRLKYFMGNLGLSSIYQFHYKDVFGYLEGAAAEFDDVKLVLLKYRSAIDASKKFRLAADFFRQSTKYENRVFNNDSFHVLDKKENQIDCYLEEDYMIILIYPPAYDIDDVHAALENALKN